MWAIIAWLVSRQPIADYLIERSKRTPYSHLTNANGHTYMERYWLFNGYTRDDQGNRFDPKFPWLPNIRVHHIRLRDAERHEHDHPYDARTIILRGYYWEQRITSCLPTRWMTKGRTVALRPNEYHRIIDVSEDGAYTLFLTWKFLEDWGFWVEGKKLAWQTYYREFLHKDF